MTNTKVIVYALESGQTIANFSGPRGFTEVPMTPGKASAIARALLVDFEDKTAPEAEATHAR